ncbi:MAG TPA: hypothetical protein VJN89_17395 [Candidatus Acidoferrum sp.]|nr:hypothetical protein [Candidatus Acidoferrum sp.]
MDVVLTTKRRERGVSVGWIWRITLGMGLLLLSLWGITICPRIFQTFIGPNPSPAETSSLKLAAAVAWFVFFGPILIAGLALFWSALRKLGALDRLEAWREERVARAYGLAPGGNPQGSRFFANEENFHAQLGALGTEEVARLTQRGNRIALLLGLSAGIFFVLIGVFGLILVSSPSLRYSGTIRFAIASGICILAGLKVLQRTLYKENNAWLLPLRAFAHLVLRRHSLSANRDNPRQSENVAKKKAG